MELPSHLKDLYRHWPLHIRAGDPSRLGGIAPPPELHAFIAERMRIWEAKTAGRNPPYTEDPVLNRYRFCNIFREFDRQTIRFHELLGSLRDDFPRWLLNMFYCRLVARTETIERVGLLSFDPEANRRKYEALMRSPRPRYGTPYVFPVSTIQRSATPTRELFLTRYAPEAVPRVAALIDSWKQSPVYDGVAAILPVFGFNLSFLWTEVLIDVAYQYPQRIDLFARFPVGPGALPTFRKMMPGKDPSFAAAELGRAGYEVGITFEGQPVRLSAENWEGIGCEFRKYGNLKAGHGRKRLYAPAASAS